MGNCMPKIDHTLEKGFKKEAQQIHMAISRQMKSCDMDDNVTRKFLLLGAGSSGKSTLMRQMKCIYGNGFEDADILFANRTIRMNCVATTLLLMRKSLELSENDEEIRAKCSIDLDASPHLLPLIELVVQHQRETFNHLADNEATNNGLRKLGHAIDVLWRLPQIQETYALRHSFRMVTNMEYFLNKVTEVFHPSFRSSNEDYIKSRVTTLMISDAMYTIEGHRLHLFDVGGQRNERQKWIHLFDGVTSVIFVAALNHFCSVLFEDENKNALEESLDLFAELINSKWFRRTHFILYLNKLDLFRQRIKDGQSLRTFFNATSYNPKNPEYFDEYLGPDYVPTGNAQKDEKALDEVVEASIEFILDQFLRRNHYPDRALSVRKALTATDETQVKQAFLDLLCLNGDDHELEVMFCHKDQKGNQKVDTELLQPSRWSLRPWLS